MGFMFYIVLWRKRHSRIKCHAAICRGFLQYNRVWLDSIKRETLLSNLIFKQNETISAFQRSVSIRNTNILVFIVIFKKMLLFYVYFEMTMPFKT